MITEKSNIQIDVNIKQIANANNKPWETAVSDIRAENWNKTE